MIDATTYRVVVMDTLRGIKKAIEALEDKPQKVDDMHNVYKLRDAFVSRLDEKTSWGRIQLTKMLLELIKNMEEGFDDIQRHH